MHPIPDNASVSDRGAAIQRLTTMRDSSCVSTSTTCEEGPDRPVLGQVGMRGYGLQLDRFIWEH